MLDVVMQFLAGKAIQQESHAWGEDELLGFIKIEVD